MIFGIWGISSPETQFLNILSNEFYNDRLLTLIKNTLSLIMIPRRRGGKICQIFDEWSKPEGGRQPRAHHVHCRRSISKIFWLLTVFKICVHRHRQMENRVCFRNKSIDQNSQIKKWHMMWSLLLPCRLNIKMPFVQQRLVVSLPWLAFRNLGMDFRNLKIA